MVEKYFLRDLIQDLNEFNKLELLLEITLLKNITSKHWCDSFLKPILIRLQFVKAEREGEKPLRLESVESILPYFFQIKSMQGKNLYVGIMLKVNVDVLEKFIKGEYVMRYKAGYWNGVCSNTYIEITFMNYKKVPGSIIGITLKTNVVEKWANRLRMCTQFLKNLDEMREFNTLQGVEYPEEKIKASITSGKEDRNSLSPVLKKWINPLSTEIDGRVMIYSGVITKDNVNAHNVANIGNQQLKKFKN